ncbi:MAG TPA: hypothetical protein VMG10_02660 [Gemmataceae bacterium]|nr:hypothetical protein [Gemmataceae bacterium]
MKARAVFVLVALLFLAGCTQLALFFLDDRAQAGSVDKARLRELAYLPNISAEVAFDYSSISGFGLGDQTDHLAAIARLQKHLKGDPSDVERYLLMGRHYGQVNRDKEAKEALKKAVAICRQQVRERPEDMSWLARLGDALVYNGETKEGEKLLHRVTQEAPSEWRGWLGVAECVDDQSFRVVCGDKLGSFTIRGEQLLIYAIIKRKPTEKQIAEMHRLWKEARPLYDRAVELAPPDEAKPHLRRINSNLKHEFIEAALRMFKGESINTKAVMFAPDCIPDVRQIARLSADEPQTVGAAMIWEIMSYVYQNKLQTREAPSSWEDHLAMRNRSLLDALPRESQESVSWCMERLEQLAKHPDKAAAAAASEILAEGLMTIKTVGEDINYSGPISSKKRDATEKILEYLRRAVQLDPSRERAWDLLTGMLAMEDKTGEAIATACKRLAVQDNAHNRFFLAKAYADGNQFDKAALALYAGLKSDPKDLNCLLGLIAVALRRDDGQSLQEAGEQLEAIASRIKEEKGKQHGRDYLLLRGIHSALTDRPGRAKAAFQRVLQIKKGEPRATRALVALGGPLDRQLAIDFVRGIGGRVGRKDAPASYPVMSIYLNRDQMTDEDLFVLTAFPQLQELNLSFGAISDTGLSSLTFLSDLQSLNLDDTKVTDKGLIHLKAFRELRYLSLNHTLITDAGLEHLRSLKQLKLVNVKSTKVTSQGVAELRQALPKLEVYR